MNRRVVLCIVVAVVILAVALAALALQASDDPSDDSSDSQRAEEVLNGGRVSEDTTITVDSEVRIGSDLVVAEGATLTIELSGTIYMDSGSRILVQGSLVVSGSSGASFESGDGSGEEGAIGGAIYVSPGGSASVSICKFARFSSDLYGGAVASEGELTLTNCSFVSCEGPSGGAVYTSGIAAVDSCVFSRCSAGEGGAVSVQGDGCATIVSCTFLACTSEGDGGAVASASGEELTVASSVFSSITSAGSGAVMAEGNLTMTSCSFGHCEAEASAMAECHGDAYFESCHVYETIASDCGGYGGAVTVIGGSATFVGCEFDGQDSTYDGSAVVVTGENATFDSCTFSDITSSADGAAVNCAVDALTMAACGFASCTSDGEGGAVYATAGTVSIEGCSFSGCTAGGNGGAVCIECSGEAAVTGCSFEQCSAENGGGIYACAEAAIEGCEFTECSAAVSGGDYEITAPESS